MSYDEVEIEDMKWDEELKAFTYQCPCGDLFQITKVGSASTADSLARPWLVSREQQHPVASSRSGPELPLAPVFCPSV